MMYLWCSDGLLLVCFPCSVYLVDHAWTYRVESARQQLIEVPGLLIRMASLMGLPFHGEAPDPDIVDLVLDNMWKFNQTYQLSQGVRHVPNLRDKLENKTPFLQLIVHIQCFKMFHMIFVTKSQNASNIVQAPETDVV